MAEVLVLCGPGAKAMLIIAIDNGLNGGDDKVDDGDLADCASMAFIRSCAPWGSLSIWSWPSISLTLSRSIPAMCPVFESCAADDAEEIVCGSSWFDGVACASVDDGPLAWITSQWTVTESWNCTGFFGMKNYGDGGFFFLVGAVKLIMVLIVKFHYAPCDGRKFFDI